MRPFLLSAGMGLFFHFFLSSDNNNNNTTNTLPISPRIQSTLSARSCFDSPRQKKKSYYGHSRRRNKRYYSAQNKWSLQLFPSRKKYKKKTLKIFLKKRDGGGKLWNKLTIFDYMMTMFASGIETSAQSHANKFPESFFLFYFVFLFPSFLPSLRTRERK